MTAWRPLFAVVAFVLVALAISVLANQLPGGPHAALAMPAEDVAESFLRSMATHRWDAASQTLSRDLREQTDAATLQALMQAFEDHYGRLDQALGEGATRQGDQATAQVTLTTEQGERLDAQFSLQVEDGGWRLTSLEPLRRLAQ